VDLLPLASFIFSLCAFIDSWHRSAVLTEEPRRYAGIGSMMNVGGGLCRRIAFGIAAECESVTTGYPWFKVMFSFYQLGQLSGATIV